MFSFSDVRAFFFLIDLRSFFCTLLSSVTVSTTSSVTAAAAAVATDDDNDDEVDSCWTVVDDDEVTLVTVVLVSIVFWTLPSLVMILKGNQIESRVKTLNRGPEGHPNRNMSENLD